MGIWSDLFTWWNGATLSTKLYTSRQGNLAGEDDAGNKYYEQRSGVGPLGKPSRWVIYVGEAEASKVPPEWHGWLHYTVDTPPNKEDYQAKPWQKPHIENRTGTPAAYRPPGSTMHGARRPHGDGDYQPWRAE